MWTISIRSKDRSLNISASISSMRIMPLIIGFTNTIHRISLVFVSVRRGKAIFNLEIFQLNHHPIFRLNWMYQRVNMLSRLLRAYPYKNNSF